jgi:hypothetical protein
MWYTQNIYTNVYFSRDDTKEPLLQTIVYGSSAIKDELKEKPCGFTFHDFTIPIMDYR